MDELRQKGIRQDYLTLHVGAGTFVPVKEENARLHSMHAEMVVVRREFLEEWKKEGRELIAVGTTSTRSLESLYWLGVKLTLHEDLLPAHLDLSQWEHESMPQDVSLGESLEALITFCHSNKLNEIHFHTQLMIVPGYRFRTIGALMTNFHMPGSTLLMLIAAWIGEDWRKVYEYALDNEFRFLSYGDSSLLIPEGSTLLGPQ